MKRMAYVSAAMASLTLLGSMISPVAHADQFSDLNKSINDANKSMNELNKGMNQAKGLAGALQGLLAQVGSSGSSVPGSSSNDTIMTAVNAGDFSSGQVAKLSNTNYALTTQEIRFYRKLNEERKRSDLPQFALSAELQQRAVALVPQENGKAAKSPDALRNEWISDRYNDIDSLIAVHLSYWSGLPGVAKSKDVTKVGFKIYREVIDSDNVYYRVAMVFE
ncbi:MAG: hypothetical protein Q3962_04425 [Corynebacterium sp.]|nr:hypothetical protein [Corynebacterium sp.]